MADMKDVVAAVKSFAGQFLGNATELGLEEFERDGHHWKVTFGYRPGWVQVRESQSPLADLQVPRREYRVFWVDDQGQVVAMKRPEDKAA